MSDVASILETSGPSRSSEVAARLQTLSGMSPEAARQVVSRAGQPIMKLKGILPKNEAFLYLESDYFSERYIDNLTEALRVTGSAYSYALDGLAARGGAVYLDEFSVISGSADRQKGHIPNSAIFQRLVDYGLMDTHETDRGPVISLSAGSGYRYGHSYMYARHRAESVLLDAFSQWLKNLGMVSCDKVAIRGDDHPRTVGPFKFDLTAPSYLSPIATLSGSGKRPGFVFADVFSDSRLDERHVAYFFRKLKSISALRNIGRVLPYLIAPGFSKEALRLGRELGVIMATPSNLFGERLGQGLNDLTQTLKNAGAVVAKEPERLSMMIDRLADIEGKSGNLRGILFELFTAFLMRHDGRWISLGTIATDPATGKSAEIDILADHGVTDRVAIECKAKVPGGELSLEEVEDWIRRIPLWTKWLRDIPARQNANLSFQIWTSGRISEDALRRLQKEKQMRTKVEIDWKDGQAVRDFAKSKKEKHVTEAFDHHFFRNPLKDIITID